MKKIMNSVSALLSRLLAGSLVLFGFGCSSEDDDEVLCMYGTPTGTFEVKGSVTTANEESTMPVDAKVIVTDPHTPSTAFYNLGTEETSSNGQYDISGMTSGNKLKVVCLPNDPNLEPDSVVVEAKFAKVSPERDFWVDLGHANVNVDFKLKEKKTEE